MNEHSPCPLPGNWQPIPELTDEFFGTVLDESKWHPCNPTWIGRAPGYFSPANVTVADGCLNLTARTEDLPGLPPEYHTFTTAAVKSKARAHYGYYEVLARPMASRCSSAFWFYAQDPGLWTEIDVFEICGAHSPQHENVLYMTLHALETPQSGKEHIERQVIYRPEVLMRDGFHRFGLEWTPEIIGIDFDGQRVGQFENTHWFQPLHLNFDSETMPEWYTLPDPATLPTTYSIEYVRAWARV